MLSRHLRPGGYYESFTKHILDTEMIKPPPPTQFITYREYFQKNISLESYRLVELKHLAKHHHLHVSGSKRALIDRLRECFIRMDACERIQTRFRGHMVRYWIRLRGPAAKDRTKCVNETDFYTMDPISEIPVEFFSYEDEKSFIYGFDVSSLLSLFQKSKQIVNPYNRESISIRLALRMVSFYAISILLFEDMLFTNSLAHEIRRISNRPAEPIHAQRRHTHTRSHPPPAVQELIDENRFVEPTTDDPAIPMAEEQTAPPTATPSQSDAYTREEDANHLLPFIRSKPWDVRVRELFMEMDQLGNYTMHTWFTEMTKLYYARLYENLYIWWEVSEMIPPEVKRSICRMPRIFAEAHVIRLYPTTPMEKYRELSLEIMEALVYTGISDEYRKLGAMHVLTVLTTVSLGARNQMPWLFESIPYRTI